MSTAKKRVVSDKRRLQIKTAQKQHRKQNEGLGKSGLKFFEVVLGAISFGSDPQALKTFNIPRSRVVMLSKCLAGIPDNPAELSEIERLQQINVNDRVMVNRIVASRKHIMDAVDASVERLGTYLDALQLQRVDPDIPMKEIMRALNDVVESGKVRYIGESSQNGRHQFISMQNLHSMLYRATGVAIIPWFPLAIGRLARSHNSDNSSMDIIAVLCLSSTMKTDEAAAAAKHAKAGLLTVEDMAYIDGLYV
ncbi:aldo-keto reductase-like protein [Calycina marina]|uniref:Aldo-keto reductase-like protein n=1 Tax=Calycina marina TaxID=1763456 RepID=A0A9P7Z774_9HELO|nr:aldo-keto reductase-like protein [Calycina marina]